MKRVLLIPLIFLVLGCNTWERTTFQTLAASKSVLDTAQNDYENGTIPKTQCAKSIIEDGKAADISAVDAMVVYEQLKAAKANLQSQEAAVVSDLAALAPMLVQIEKLTTNPAAACGGAK